ncbi:transmembrane protein 216 isoform X1 [Monodelphis domestica]|uniref:transmembrane protein 216 isoform X1 n=1 Tax=Monodelphis domestica TaxID=13616 RepID=UPI00028BD9DD|nr:transmembrane protein 216 isoform X1 [Monodelphis domestica]
MALRGRRLSSVSLEILFFLNGWYSATYFLLELFTFLYKGLLLPYPTANLILDLVMLFLYLGIEITRIFFGTKGNLCQRMMPLGISLALTFPSAMMASYYLLLQTYVLRLEAVMGTILLLFCALEVILEVLTLSTFSSIAPVISEKCFWLRREPNPGFSKIFYIVFLRAQERYHGPLGRGRSSQFTPEAWLREESPSPAEPPSQSQTQAESSRPLSPTQAP